LRAFIQKQPLTMSAHEVVRAAKQSGIPTTKTSAAIVYNVRSEMKKQRQQGAPEGKVVQLKRRAPDDAEAVFIAAALRLGTARAQSLLAGLEESAARKAAGA
jgi:hypothetical protein